MPSGALRRAGYDGLDWSSTASYNAIYAYYFDLYDDVTYLSDNSSRYTGFTDRKANPSSAITVWNGIGYIRIKNI